MLRSILALFILTLVFQPTRAQELISADSIDHYTVSEMGDLGVSANNPVTVFRVKYRTLELDSSMDTASGALLLPDMEDCAQGFPLLSYQHGTVVKDSNVPSQDGGLRIGLFYAGDSYVTCMPDFLGLGSNEGLHPYHHSRTEATASLDMMRASRDLLDSTGRLTLNGQVFLSGYSQGGHATMALHRYIESNSLLGSFDIKVSTPMSGAYALSGVQGKFPTDSTYPSPAYYPYITESYKKAYGTLYDSLEEYYKPPYDSLIPIYLSGDSTLGSFNDALPNNLYQFMEDSVLDAYRADSSFPYSHPLREALYQNDLYRWAPQRRTRLFYCGGDEQVYPKNSRIAEDSMNARGAQDLYAEDLNSSFGHGGCIPFAVQESKAAFDSLRSGCMPNSIQRRKDLQEKLEIREMSGGRKKVLVPFEKTRYKVYSIRGELCEKGRIRGDDLMLRTRQWSSGVYVIRVTREESARSLQQRFLVR